MEPGSAQEFVEGWVAAWNAAMKRVPNLHFELIDTYVGVDVLVINYRNERGGLVCEVLRFVDDLVVEGGSTYVGLSIPS